jgi:3-hydroxyacyl-CoA dehydrogenase
VYAANLIPEVGDSPEAIDDAMKMGYNWIKGPFELIDEIGSDYLIKRLEKEQRNVPDYLKIAKSKRYYNGLDVLTATGKIRTIMRPDGTLRFNDMKKILSPKDYNQDASWYDIDGVALVEFHSKANALGQNSMLILEEAIDAVSNSKMKGIIVHNDSQHFSCGVNLNSVRLFYENEDWDGLDKFLKHFQDTVHKLAVAEFPTIVAPVGLSLGGGFEVVLHAKEVICHANSNMGLVESGVGLIPAGGGCKETLYRWIENKNGDVDSAAWEAFYSLGYGKTASSPIKAKQLAMLRDNDTYENNRDRILNASIKSIGAQKNQKPFKRPPVKMSGRNVFNKMVDWAENMALRGKLYPHDVTVSTEIARIVTGGDIEPGTLWTEQDLYDAERKAFLILVKSKPTQARIKSLLDDGKALRN